MPNSTISETMTISHWSRSYPRPEPAILEHDISPPKRLPTEVFTGIPIRGQVQVLFTAVNGYTAYQGDQIKLQFVAYSQVSADPSGRDFSYAVANQGSPFAFTWEFAGDPILQDIASDSGLYEYPFSLAPEDPFIAFSASSDAATVIGTPVFTVLSPAGDPLFLFTSPVFRPQSR